MTRARTIALSLALSLALFGALGGGCVINPVPTPGTSADDNYLPPASDAKAVGADLWNQGGSEDNDLDALAAGAPADVSATDASDATGGADGCDACDAP